MGILKQKFIQEVISVVKVHSMDFSTEEICIEKTFSTLFVCLSETIGNVLSCK